MLTCNHFLPSDVYVSTQKEDLSQYRFYNWAERERMKVSSYLILFYNKNNNHKMQYKQVRPSDLKCKDWLMCKIDVMKTCRKGLVPLSDQEIFHCYFQSLHSFVHYNKNTPLRLKKKKKNVWISQTEDSHCWKQDSQPATQSPFIFRLHWHL